MKQSVLFRNWWVILLQGVLLIILSIIIFNNAGTVLAAIAFWLGLIVIITGVIGSVAYFGSEKDSRDLPALLGSIAIVILGMLMISKMFVTMKAITFVFGLLVAVVGILLISGSFSSKKESSLWWVITLLGLAALITGIKSMLDINSGAENISTLVGLSVLISGLGLVFMAFLKRRMVTKITGKLDAAQGWVNKG